MNREDWYDREINEAATQITVYQSPPLLEEVKPTLAQVFAGRVGGVHSEDERLREID